MAALYVRHLKGGDVWYVDFSYQGERYRMSTGTTDRKLAELQKNEIEVNIAKGTFDPKKPIRKEVYLSEFIEKYLKHSKAEKAPNSFELDKRYLRFFSQFVGDKPLSRISIEDAENYKLFRSEKVKQTSVNLELRHLKSAFERAVKWDHIKKNPFKDVKQFKTQKEHPAFFTKEDLIQVLKTIPESEFKNLIYFYLYTGCRRNEALNLKWEEATEGELRESMTILNAYYLPNFDKNVLYPSITPVNSFRLVFNFYFNTDFKLLPDKSFATCSGHPYKFFDVTDKIQ